MESCIDCVICYEFGMISVLRRDREGMGERETRGVGWLKMHNYDETGGWPHWKKKLRGFFFFFGIYLLT